MKQNKQERSFKMEVNKNICVLKKSLLVNIILVFMKLIVGFIGHSKSLLADGVHSLSDLGTDVMSMISSKISEKPADKEHPLGHGQIEYLCCLAIGLIVIFLGVSIIKEAFIGKVSLPSNIVFFVTILTITLKFDVSSYLLREGEKNNNSLLIVSGKESRADVISSFVVLITFVLSKLTVYNDIFKYSDLVGAIILGLLIIFIGIKIFIENFTTILSSKEEDPKIINKVKELISNNYNEVNISKVLLLKYGPYYKCELDILMDKNMTINNSYKIQKKLKKVLLKSELNINYIDINIKPEK